MALLRRLRPPLNFFVSKCLKHHEPIDEPIDEQFHMVPLGKSEITLQSRVSFLSKDMIEEKIVGIKSLSSAGFRLFDNQFMFGPIAVFPKTVLSWRVASVNDITPESLELFFLLQPKLDILVIGVGDQSDIDKVRKKIAPVLHEKRIPYELLKTEFAISTFNFLNSEGRSVGAVLFPPENIHISIYKHGEAMSCVRNYFDGEFNPLLMTINYTHDPVYDIVERVFGSTTTSEERSKIRNRVRQIRAYNKNQKNLYFERRYDVAEPARIEDLFEVKNRLKEIESQREKEHSKKVGSKEENSTKNK